MQLDRKCGKAESLFYALIRTLNDNRRCLVGRLLTINDGVARDDVQRKAVKDLIESTVFHQLGLFEETMADYCEYLAKEFQEEFHAGHSTRVTEADPFK